MPKYRIDAEHIPTVSKFAFVVSPPPHANILAYRSDGIYESHDKALIAGVQYLESKGLKDINWHAVVSIVDQIS